MDFEKLIEMFVLNFKKYMYGVFALILGLVLVNCGMVKAIVVFIITVLGFKLGDDEFQNKLKKYIINRFKD